MVLIRGDNAPLRPFPVVLAAAVSLLVAACGVDDDQGAAPDEQPEAAPAWTACTNEADGWIAEYPEDWQANEGDVVPPCSLFDPGSVSVPEAPTTLPLDIAVQVRSERIALDFDNLVEDPFADELDRHDTRIDGHAAVRIDQRQTEDGIIPAGTRSVRYVVDRGEHAVIAVSYDVGEPTFDAKVDVLDEMMQRIELVDGDAPAGGY